MVSYVKMCLLTWQQPFLRETFRVSERSKIRTEDFLTSFESPSPAGEAVADNFVGDAAPPSGEHPRGHWTQEPGCWIRVLT